MYYPFPVDSLHPYPEFIWVDGLPFIKADSGIYFRFEIGAAAACSLEVAYRQRILGRSARYILTTLQEWDRPIEEAVFKISLPRDLPGVELSYPADSLSLADGSAVYLLTFRDFMPEKDLLITW
jgi:hypothetical protein